METHECGGWQRKVLQRAACTEKVTLSHIIGIVRFHCIAYKAQNIQLPAVLQ